jgi:precorrin isomerase
MDASNIYKEYNKVLDKLIIAEGRLEFFNELRWSIKKTKAQGYDSIDQIIEIIKDYERIIIGIKKELSIKDEIFKSIMRVRDPPYEEPKDPGRLSITLK